MMILCSKISRKGAKEAKAQRENSLLCAFASFAPLREMHFVFYFMSLTTNFASGDMSVLVRIKVSFLSANLFVISNTWNNWFSTCMTSFGQAILVEPIFE